MFATDDHGRFGCFCRGHGSRKSRKDVVAEATVEEVEKERKREAVGGYMQRLVTLVVDVGDCQDSDILASDEEEAKSEARIRIRKRFPTVIVRSQVAVLLGAESDAFRFVVTSHFDNKAIGSEVVQNRVSEAAVAFATQLGR
jgi:hypothetical protein